MLEAVDEMLRRCLLVAGCFLLAQAPAFAADAKQGKAIAERWCSGCHVVGHEQKSASNDQAPTFASLAARADFNTDRLAFLLLKPHPNMPQLSLGRSEIVDLAEYILTLK